MLTTLTSKEQLTVPKNLREQLHLHSGDKIEIILDENNQIIIKPIKSSVKKLKTVLPPPDKTLSLDEIEDVIQERRKNG